MKLKINKIKLNNDFFQNLLLKIIKQLKWMKRMKNKNPNHKNYFQIFILNYIAKLKTIKLKIQIVIRKYKINTILKIINK